MLPKIEFQHKQSKADINETLKQAL